MASRSANPGPAPHERPRFFWQGLLIVLPVVVLAVFALFSLRQDQALAEHEAREKAQAEADQIADRLWAALDDPSLRAAFQNWHRLRGSRRSNGCHLNQSGLNPAFLFQVDAAGELLFPPHVPELPPPRLLNPADLNTNQTARWLAAQAFVLDSPTNLAATVESLRQFIALAPPDAFAAAARFQLGVLLGRDHQPEQAAQEFQTLAKTFPDSTGESGLPLPPLALLKAAEQSRLITNAGAASASALLDAACSNAVTAPSSITPHLLRAALPLDSAPSTNFVARWQARWQEHETARALHAAAQPAFAVAVANAVRQRTDERVRNLPFPVAMPPATALPPRLFWFVMPTGFGTSDAKKEGFHYGPSFWLASRIDRDTNGHWFLCRPPFDRYLGSRYIYLNVPKRDEARLTAVVNNNGLKMARKGMPGESPVSDPLVAEVEKQRSRLPDYFGLSLELAGRVLISSNALPAFDYVSGNKGGGHYWTKSASATAPPLLASARHVEDGVEYLRVGIHLTSPKLLYARQQSRTRLFGLLIGASALAAVIGFVSARRAFLRQQQLAEMKSNFVSSVSHELRAPIASVRLMAESLDRGKVSEPAKQREYFRFIVQECRRLGTLIENVLDFARIEQGRKQYEFEPTDVSALLRQTVQLMEPAATERGVTLELPNPQPSTFNLQPCLDGAALQQALVNLLDNAIKHAPPNTTVTVALNFIPHNSSFILSVEDHGPGIPAAEHGKIFERFYRRGSELRRETQGVGIGLSIVKHIVEAHGGCVRVESEVGRGSRFVIELPTNSHHQKK